MKIIFKRKQPEITLYDGIKQLKREKSNNNKKKNLKVKREKQNYREVLENDFLESIFKINDKLISSIDYNLIKKWKIFYG